MLISKIFFRVMLIFLVFISCIIVLTLINTPNIMNSYSSKLMCENTLKMIANAAKLYQNEWEGQWPPSLLELGLYYEGKYKPEPNNIPKCPGGGSFSGDTSSSEYHYYQPKVAEVIPVCWDSKPHRTKGVILSDTFSWNVLYSDGHIERLSKKKLIHELSQLAETNPDLLRVLQILNDPNNEN